MPNIKTIILLILWACAVAGCMELQRQTSVIDDTHNAAGGYTEACGEMPGLIGDDC